MEYEITIVVDTNDADYRTSVQIITEEELDRIMPLSQAIKKFEPYESVTGRGHNRSHQSNYPTEDCCREDLGQKTVVEFYSDISEEIHDLFQEYCPWEEHGFHTVKSIHLCPVVEKDRLL